MTPTATTTGEHTPSGTATPTETDTPTETPTETPVPRELRIERANLVWGSTGGSFLEDNAIESTGAGGSLRVGVRVSMPARSERITPDVEVTVFDEAGTEAASQSVTDTVEVGDVDYATEDVRGYVDVTGHSTGSYTAEVTVASRNRGAYRSGPHRFSFELVEPLESHEVRLYEYDPRTVSVGEPVTWEMRLQNRSDRDSSVVDRLHWTQPGTNSFASLAPVTLHLPADSVVTRKVGEITFNDAGTYRFRIPSADVEWETEAIE